MPGFLRSLKQFVNRYIQFCAVKLGHFATSFVVCGLACLRVVSQTLRDQVSDRIEDSVDGPVPQLAEAVARSWKYYRSHRRGLRFPIGRAGTTLILAQHHSIPARAGRSRAVGYSGVSAHSRFLPNRQCIRRYRSECRLTFKSSLTQPRLLEMDVKPAIR
jgi:hypothetical protein